MTKGALRRLTDHFARWGITIGGVFVILCIIGMMVFLGAEVLPLWSRPDVSAGQAFSARSAAPASVFASNEYREIFFEVSSGGETRIFVAEQEGPLEEGRLAFPDSLGDLRITAAAPLAPGAREWVAGTGSGHLIHLELADEVAFTAEGRRYEPEIRASEPLPMSDGAIQFLGGTLLEDGAGFSAVAWAGGDTLRLLHRRERRSLLGDVSYRDRRDQRVLPAGTRPSAFGLDYRAQHLFVGTESGSILEYDLESDVPPVEVPIWSDEAVRSLGFLVGQHSLIIGGGQGSVEVWFRARLDLDEAETRLIQGHRFESHDGAVLGSTASSRDRTFVTWDDQGNAKLHYATSSSTRMTFDVGTTDRLVLAPRGDGLLASLGDGSLRVYRLDNPHPEASVRSLFGKVHYEGYPEPEFVWQSTGASDEVEPKLSLIPLIFGTLKGTFYTLLFSIPIAVLAAVYSSLFMTPRLRGIVKPTMEMMAALPSVVLGFLAGLWLAPMLQRSIPAALLLPIPIVAAVLFFGWLWRRLPQRWNLRRWPGLDTLLLIGVLVAVIGVFVGLNPVLDDYFQGGFLDWLYTNFDVRYDQRNALVIGIAMGIAVIPIIFTISEDSLSNVPRALRAASLALGATPWQTAWRVVLPAASPGIFAAIVIGLGRAIGETMIVLMATGNTPIMDWSAFNGFRTLAANIAVEIPEAPHEGTLYRVLFLTALILFSMTFVVNTIAEIVRNRLRRKYSRF